MTILGIGPKLAISGLAGLSAVIALDIFAGFALKAPENTEGYLLAAGIIVALPGLLMWASSAKKILKGFNAHELVTTGAFAYSRNPMYSAFIFFLVPAIALIFNNFLFLIVSVILYTAFKMTIVSEEEYLETEFGEDYKKYKMKVPELFPWK